MLYSFTRCLLAKTKNSKQKVELLSRLATLATRPLLITLMSELIETWHNICKVASSFKRLSLNDAFLPKRSHNAVQIHLQAFQG